MATEINIELDLKKFRLTESERDVITKYGFVNIFETLLTSMVAKKYPDGLAGQDLKIFNRILRILDSSTSNLLCFEEAELDLIKEAFINWNIPVPATQVRLFCAYKEMVEKAIL